MDDKELLELAAKAAGIEHPGGEHSISNDGRLWDCNGLRWWNPLTDDGDALRLAVKLNILRGYIYNDEVSLAPSEYGVIEPVINNDPYAATRRAIVRVAAEIGKTTK